MTSEIKDSNDIFYFGYLLDSLSTAKMRFRAVHIKYKLNNILIVIVSAQN